MMIALIFSGCSSKGSNDVQPPVKNGEKEVSSDEIYNEPITQEEKSADYTIGMTSDYIFAKVGDLYENAAGVVVAEYVGEKSLTADYSAIVTHGEFKIEKVFKGDFKENNSIVINFYGGMMSLAEYEKNLTEEQRVKMGFDNMTDEEKTSKFITMSMGDSTVDAKEGQRYLIFFSHDGDTNFVLSDSFGMRPLNDKDQAFDPETKQFETVDFITKNS